MIGRREVQLRALLNSGVKAFVLVTDDLTDSQNAEIVIKHIDKVFRNDRRKQKALIAKIRKDAVVMWRMTSPFSKDLKGRIENETRSPKSEIDKREAEDQKHKKASKKRKTAYVILHSRCVGFHVGTSSTYFSPSLVASTIRANRTSTEMPSAAAHSSSSSMWSGVKSESSTVSMRSKVMGRRSSPTIEARRPGPHSPLGNECGLRKALSRYRTSAT